MSIESQIADLTTATTDLIAAVNVKKVALDNAVQAAEDAAARVEDAATLAILDQALEAVGAAEAAAVAANSARDASFALGPKYATEAEGRAAVADGATFLVIGEGAIAAYEFRRVSSSASTLLAMYPTLAFTQSIVPRLNRAGMAKFVGTGTLYPIATDRFNKILLGWDAAKKTLFGPGLVTASTVRPTVFFRLGAANFTGLSTAIVPIATDSQNRILLGWDRVNKQVFARGLATTQQATDIAREMSGGAGVASSRFPKLTAGLVPVKKALNHMIGYGQSLSIGAAGQAALSTSQPYANVTFAGGPRAAADAYSPLKALVEDDMTAPDGGNNRGETFCAGAANFASTLALTEDGAAPDDHVILASTAGLGGARIDELQKGSAWYPRLLAHATQAHAINADHAVHAVIWIQGENDAITSRQTPYSTYRAALEQLQVDADTDIRAATGQASPVHFITYQLSYAAATWPAQALAQLDLVQKNPKFHLSTPCYHLPFALDNVHLTRVGYKWLGAYIGRAYKRLVLDGTRPAYLNPRSATRRGAVITVEFDVPRPPLVLDTVTLAATLHHGFRVTVGGNTATISSIAVQGSKVVITLSAIPGATTKVRYALDYLGSGLSITGGASGNLRDSTTETILIDGVARPLYHVAPHFELTAYPLGE